MKEIKEIHPTQQPAKDSGDWEIVKPVTATIIDQSTGMVEWTCELTKEQLLNVQKILEVQKINVALANEVYRLIREGKSQKDIERIKRGGKKKCRNGYSLGSIKRYSSAISKVFKWKRNIAVSKNK